MKRRFGQEPFARKSPNKTAIAQRVQALREAFKKEDLSETRRLANLLLLDDPRNLDALNHLGLVANKEGDYTQALGYFDSGLKYHPNSYLLHGNKGVVYNALGEYETALEHHQRSMECNSRSALVLNNVGNTLQRLGRDPEALELFERALALNPQDPRIWCNKAASLRDLGDLKGAVEACQRSLQVNPAYAEAYFTLATLHLLQGEFREGWAKYEHRWGMKVSKAPMMPEKRWDAQLSLQNKRLVLLGEQGFGDNIQFMRYGQLFGAQGAQVILQVRPGLVRFCQNFEGFAAVSGENLRASEFDYYLSLLSAPHLLRTTLEDVPPLLPIKKTFENPALQNYIREQPGRLKVGITWGGSRTNHNDRKRSCSLRHFRGLAELPGVQLFSLQKGPYAAELAQMDFPVSDLQDFVHDFYDAACAVQELDLVVTVDTSLAHLAGSLNRKTWVLLACVPDWRWLLAGETSPWYPSVQLFRQESYGQWAEVFRRVADRLSLSLQ